MNDKSDRDRDDYSDEEIARRRDNVIRRMANTPPKPHSQMKLAKHRAKASQKTVSVSGQMKHAKARKAKIRNNSPH